MKNLYILFLISFFGISNSYAQSLASEVYTILQTSCATPYCHSSDAMTAGLDLQGTGSNPGLEVYNNIVGVSPANSYAQNKGYQLIYPGRPDLSFLFRKINQGLEPLINLHEDEKSDMPMNGILQDVEKEKIRQWILYGASLTDTPSVNGVTVSSMVEDYYSGNGEESFPDGPPAAPAEGEGFQIKMGPFFLPPSGEVEYFQKYELDLAEDVEVNRIDMKMSSYSHHLIVYDFNPGGSNSIPTGYRLEPDHSDIGLVAAIQQPEDIRLPEGTAFKWDKNLVVDLNSHYINYNPSQVYKSESYVNIYTQDSGTAAQEMHTELIANGGIYIPNNGDMITHTQNINYFLGDIHIWGLMGHTHKYGRGYKVFERINGQRGELLYDASCPQATPGCVSPFFDYQHIPFKKYNSFLPIKMNFSNGLVHEASWVNDGPSSVGFGPTSDDEMMVLVIMYVEDLEGVTVSNKEVQNQVEGVSIYPNPMGEFATIKVPEDFKPSEFSIYDLTGKLIRNSKLTKGEIYFEKGSLDGGMYIYRIADSNGKFATGKIVIQ